MNFGIIIPAHNEANYIVQTLESLFSQTLLPTQIIVVDDASTDETPLILDKIRRKNPILEVIRKENTGKHLPGSKVVQTFNTGLPFLRKDIDIICKFDADLVFPTDYLATLQRHFLENSQLGMCGGFCYIEKNGTWELENLTNRDHLRGALKAYRKDCFSNIGGLPPAMGWDTIDELLARYFGWEVCTDSSLKVKHLKPTGTSYTLQARLLQGGVFYRLRYGFWLSLLASAKLASKKRKWQLFKDYLQGYFNAKREKQPYLVTYKQGQWIRNYRWKGVWKQLLKIKS
ncbi:glycosyltransferase family 2 protein [Capnocytophaga canis]|uniref:glycosyltransferase family 2 protein n=1 Tax=Capnocytophaga canis TaxID=1848903 RepID=UPI0037D7D9C2